MEDLQEMLSEWLLVSSNLSSFPPNDPVAHFNAFLYPGFYKCSRSDFSSQIFGFFTSTYCLLLLPLFFLVLYVSIQRWRQWRSSTPFTVSHTDFFTYSINFMEPIGLFGSLLYCCGTYMEDQWRMNMGVYSLFISLTGRLMFHCLICVEQYLAVIHPITYLSLKNERGIRVRNIFSGCIWLVAILMLALVILYSPVLITIPFFAIFGLGLFVVCFCSLSVLFALIRPGPGEVGGDRKRASQSKKKAFYIIAAIVVVTFTKYVGLLVCMGLYSLLKVQQQKCVALMSAFWFCLPSSLLSPLLFLLRTRKYLPCTCHKVESE